MKRFSEIDYSTFENKKYSKKAKNDIYSLIKENTSVNISPLNENAVASIDNLKINLDINDLVNEVDKYVDGARIEERLNTLLEIKKMALNGILNLEVINEEIEKCECSEMCPTEAHGGDDTETEEEVDDNYLNDYVDDDEDEIENDEVIDVLESERLAKEFINIYDDGKAKNMDWNTFFSINNVPDNKRTNMMVERIYNYVNSARPDIKI